MAEKFLYYVGAGASAQALPVVKDSDDGQIRGLASGFEQLAKDLNFNGISLKHHDYLAGFAKKLHWLAQECGNFTTIDTYAKFLHLKDKDKLSSLKSTLSLYFSIEQLVNQKRDKRYLIWLTSILTRTIFPDNIKILTWNYDFQFELASELFSNEEFHYSHDVSVHTPPLIEYYPPIGNVFPQSTDGYSPDEISLLHLNGIAGFCHNKKTGINENLFLNMTNDRDEMLSRLINDAEHKTDLLTFAWETATGAAKHLARRLEFAEHMARDTSILVIIGYSFPFFNRAVDKRIFDKLKASGKLKKIYFQDPYLDGSFLVNQFELQDIEIVHVKRVDSFFIPMEL